MRNIYDPSFVKDLFNNMSASYEKMNTITSFGFSQRWRKAMVSTIPIKKGDTVVDLLTGMGECWNGILQRVENNGRLIALDFSKEMIIMAKKKSTTFPNHSIQVLEEDVFSNSIPNGIADCITSGFGLKTFNEEQLHRLALETKRILKNGGRFSFIDVSIPDNKILRIFYMLYLKNVIPLLGRLFLGSPETYRMLGIYTEQFQNVYQAVDIFRNAGLEVKSKKYFFGCASGFIGRKKP